MKVSLRARPRSSLLSASIVLAATWALLPSTPVDADQAARVQTSGRAELQSTIWRPNGTVHVLARTRTRVYLGGEFTGMTSPDGRQGVRNVRVAALKRSTGQLVRTFHARVNGTVRAMAVLDHRLYIGGDFTRVGDSSRRHLAALNLRTGHLVRGWKMQVDGPVLALLPMRGRLYVGGNFGQAGEFARDKLFALTGRGRMVDGWPALDTGTNGGAYVLAATHDRTAVIVGGAFHTLVGQPRTFLGSITTDGQATAWAPRPMCTTNCFVKSLAVTGTRVFAGIAGPGGHAAAYGFRHGQTVWKVKTSGDVTAVLLDGRHLLLGGHFEFVSHRPRTMFAEVRARSGAVLTRRLTTAGHHYPGILAMEMVRGVALLAGAFDDVSGQRHLAVVRP
jgi:hypothetical protein